MILSFPMKKIVAIRSVERVRDIEKLLKISNVIDESGVWILQIEVLMAMQTNMPAVVNILNEIHLNFFN